MCRNSPPSWIKATKKLQKWCRIYKTYTIFTRVLYCSVHKSEWCLRQGVIKPPATCWSLSVQLSVQPIRQETNHHPFPKLAGGWETLLFTPQSHRWTWKLIYHPGLWLLWTWEVKWRNKWIAMFPVILTSSSISVSSLNWIHIYKWLPYPDNEYLCKCRLIWPTWMALF